MSLSVNSMGTDPNFKGYAQSAGQVQTGTIPAKETAAQIPESSDKVSFSGKENGEDGKKKTNWTAAALTLLIAGGLGYVFRSNISKILGFGKKTGKASEEAVNFVKQQMEATAKKTKPIQEFIDSKLYSKNENPITKNARDKVKEMYSNLFDSKEYKEIQEKIAEKLNIKAAIKEHISKG